jgi:hypothetical protein
MRYYFTSKYDGITYDDGIIVKGVFDKGRANTQADFEPAWMLAG